MAASMVSYSNAKDGSGHLAAHNASAVVVSAKSPVVILSQVAPASAKPSTFVAVRRTQVTHRDSWTDRPLMADRCLTTSLLTSTANVTAVTNALPRSGEAASATDSLRQRQSQVEPAQKFFSVQKRRH